MNRRFFSRAISGLLVAAAGAPTAARAAVPAKVHRIAVQVSSGDVAIMNLALGNITNAADHYAHSGQPVELELVAYGPGYAMLRADTSPVKARISELRHRFPSIAFSACQNTRRALAKAEGKTIDAIVQVPEATDVPSGVVRLSELQEQGWSYIRP